MHDLELVEVIGSGSLVELTHHCVEKVIINSSTRLLTGLGDIHANGVPISKLGSLGPSYQTKPQPTVGVY